MQMAASDKKVIMQPLLEKHMDTKEDTEEDTTVFVLKRCSDCSEKSVQMRQKNACS